MTGSRTSRTWKTIEIHIDPGPKGKRERSEKGFNTKFEKKKDNKLRKDNTSQWKSPRTTTAKQNDNNSRDEHTDGKKDYEGIAEDVVEKRKEGKTMHSLHPRQPHLEKMSKADCSSNYLRIPQ